MAAQGLLCLSSHWWGLVFRLSEEDGDLAELLVESGDSKTGKELAVEYCRPLCTQSKDEL